jgi:hypothetical protein
MDMKHSVKIAAIVALSAGFIAAPASAASPKAAEANEKASKTAETAKPEKPAGEHARGADAALAQFDADGDGAISEAEKVAAGERYKKVTEAMARKQDGGQQHADRMAKREAVAAMKSDKEATREAVKSGDMTKEEAKAAKKDEKKWWQFWKSGS